MPGTIICGVHDHSDVVTASLAACLAERLGMHLLLLHVRKPGTGASSTAMAAAEDAALARLEPDQVDTRFESGETVERLRSAGGAAELVVVGATREGVIHEALHGSVTAAVTREPPAPVAIVPPDCDPLGAPATIVCGVRDHADRSSVALSAELAERLDAALVLVHVLTPTMAAASAPVLTMPPDARMFEHAEETVRRLAVPHAERLLEPPRIEVRVGAVGHELAEAAKAAGAALLVVGGSDRSPLSTAIVGAPAWYAVRHGGCPVVVTPHDVGPAAA